MDEDYKFFGLEKGYTTIKQAKRAYYNLALLVHPDRNSCPDRTIACSEMHTVVSAYNRIIEDISNNDKNRVFLECTDLSKYHEKELTLIDISAKELPSFMDIYIETHDDIKKFNNAWDNRNEETKELDYSMNSSIGYNTLPSQYVGMSMEDMSYSPELCLSNANMFEEFKKTNSEIISIDELSSANLSNYGFDYQEAHGTPSILEDRLPTYKIEMYKNPPEIGEAFKNKCEEVKNIPN